MSALDRLPTPADIEARLSAEVIGQTQAKRVLASVAFKHLALIELDQSSVGRGHVLLLGPTGSGKSQLIETLGRCLDLPTVRVDATTLTESGYRGRDVDSIFEELIRSARGDRRRAESGIVFLDEFDKIRSRSGGDRDIRGEGVQYSLLRVLDGENRFIEGPVARSQQNDASTFSTRRILFVFAGAFTYASQAGDVIADDLHQLEPYGFIPELLGRISTAVAVQALSVGDLMAILDEGLARYLADYIAVLAEFSCELNLTVEAKRLLSKMAHERGLGARGLRNALEPVLLPALHVIVGRKSEKIPSQLVVDVQADQLTASYRYKARLEARYAG